MLQDFENPKQESKKKQIEPHESEASEIFSNRRRAAKQRKINMQDLSGLESVNESEREIDHAPMAKT